MNTIQLPGVTNSTISNLQIIDLPKILDPRGNLSFIEEYKHVPFHIERSYWIYDVPGGEKRGAHAYRKGCEFIIAISGSFDINIDDGVNEERYALNRSYYGIYIPNMLWRSFENFSTNSLALVLSSTRYDESDYIRDYELFLYEKNNR